VEQPICGIVNPPDLSDIKPQGLTKHAKDSVAGLGKTLRFRQHARHSELQIGLSAHAVALNGVQQDALEGCRIHATLDDVVVCPRAHHFQRLQLIVDADDGDNGGVVRGSNQAL
jgi:hypothetical protein